MDKLANLPILKIKKGHPSIRTARKWVSFYSPSAWSVRDIFDYFEFENEIERMRKGRVTVAAGLRVAHVRPLLCLQRLSPVNSDG